MSAVASLALQTAVHDRLSGALTVPVLDALPSGTAPETYVLIGPEEIRDASDISGAGAEHRFSVSVVSRTSGFAEAKAVAASVSQSLLSGGIVLGEARLVAVWFHAARAVRLENGALRRVDLTFRARVEIL